MGGKRHGLEEGGENPNDPTGDLAPIALDGGTDDAVRETEGGATPDTDGSGSTSDH